MENEYFHYCRILCKSEQSDVNRNRNLWRHYVVTFYHISHFLLCLIDSISLCCWGRGRTAGMENNVGRDGVFSGS